MRQRAVTEFKMKTLVLDQLINFAIEEDAVHRDITTNILIAKQQILKAFIIVKSPAVLCGIDIAGRIYKKLDRTIRFSSAYRDGDRVKANTRIVTIQGKTNVILRGERIALNFLSYLSAIATKTSEYVRAVRPYKTTILDTRKTTPGLRFLERMAVRCGGGRNHRNNLAQMVLIKDNHRHACAKMLSLYDLIQKVKRSAQDRIEVEVNNLTEFKDALRAGPDIILLDNMNLKMIRNAMKIYNNIKLSRKPLLEASGGITLDHVRRIAQTGIHRISIGDLTHSRKSIDMSLEVMK